MIKETTGYFCNIYIAGDIFTIKRVCREFCFKVGLCVNVTETSFIYTGGEENGAKIELINYARFPSTEKAIWETAVSLADELRVACCQKSYSVCDREKSYYYSEKKDD